MKESYQENRLDYIVRMQHKTHTQQVREQNAAFHLPFRNRDILYSGPYSSIMRFHNKLEGMRHCWHENVWEYKAKYHALVFISMDRS